MDLTRVALATVLAIGGCAPARAPAVPSGSLVATDGAARPLVEPGATLTVIEFFSAHCPCQAEHDARLEALAAEYAPRGVAFVAVDSESGASLERDRAEAVRRGYRYPILIDPGGAVARAMRADFATYTVVVAGDGRVLYRGGIDSDRSHLTGDAAPYLRDAIDDALAGRAPRRAETKALGCALTVR